MFITEISIVMVLAGKGSKGHRLHMKVDGIVKKMNY